MFKFIYEMEIGEVVFGEFNGAICFIEWGWNGRDVRVGGEVRETPLIKEAHSQLVEYLAGNRREFDLPLDPLGTDFQKRVWTTLREIPYGEVRSYKEIAEAIGNPKAVRAVGGANNRNPISIVVPCHRVIGTDGSLTGYGGGLPMKEKLLKLEGVLKNQELR